MSFDIAKIRQFSGLTDADAALLATMGPAVEKHTDAMVTAFYEHIGKEPELAALLAAKPGRTEMLGKHFAAWLKSLTSGKYEVEYLNSRYAIGQRHVEVGLDPCWVVAAMSFCRQHVDNIIEAEYAAAADKNARMLALSKVMDLDLNIMLQSYDDKRMDMFLETTGFSKALFESMINSAGI